MTSTHTEDAIITLVMT